MTSSMRSPRRLLALCSPSTQVSASTTLLLPQPFGPTMAVTPSSKVSSDRSGQLLKPAISIRFNSMVSTSLLWPCQAGDSTGLSGEYKQKKLRQGGGIPRPGSSWERFYEGPGTGYFQQQAGARTLEIQEVWMV